MENTENYKNKTLIVFDLDGTLAPSKSLIEPDVAALVCRLLEVKKVAVISGGMFSQFETQFLAGLPAQGETTRALNNLFLFPLDGSVFYERSGATWVKVYEEPLYSADEKEKIIQTIKEAELAVLGEILSDIHDGPYGEIIEDRGSQVTFSALGQHAPLDKKAVWDPDHEKRKKMIIVIAPELPDYDVNIGGATSIDITRKGVNKAYAIRKIEESLKIPVKDMLFVGDAIYEGGNDYRALETGVDYVKVRDPQDTAKLIAQLC